MSPPSIFTVSTAWVDLFALKITASTTHLYGSLHELTFRTIPKCPHHPYLLHPLHPLHDPLHGFTFCTKSNGPHHTSAWLTAWVNFFEPYLNVPTTHIYCVHCIHCVHCVHCVTHCMTHCMDWPFCTKGNGPHHPSAWLTAWVNFFELYLNVPTTHIYCVHCMTHCMGLPFCTKGNSPHHPYLLSTLRELTFLHQHLLCPLHDPLRGLTFLY